MREARTDTIAWANAMEVLDALHAAGPGGLPTQQMPFAQPVLGQAVALLRDMGFVVIARRAGYLSYWWIAPVDTNLYQTSVDRYVQDAYTATARLGRAVAGLPGASKHRKVVKANVTMLGVLVNGADPDEDVKPVVQMPEDLHEWALLNGYLTR